MSTKSRSTGGRRRAGRPKDPSWADPDDELPAVETVAKSRRGSAANDEDEARQSEARRRLEQYMESKRLRAHLQEIFYDEEL